LQLEGGTNLFSSSSHFILQPISTYAVPCGAYQLLFLLASKKQLSNQHLKNPHILTTDLLPYPISVSQAKWSSEDSPISDRHSRQSYLDFLFFSRFPPFGIAREFLFSSVLFILTFSPPNATPALPPSLFPGFPLALGKRAKEEVSPQCEPPNQLLL